jgi:hypothetical protein
MYKFLTLASAIFFCILIRAIFILLLTPSRCCFQKSKPSSRPREAARLCNQKTPHLSLNMKTPHDAHLQKIPAMGVGRNMLKSAGLLQGDTKNANKIFNGSA